MEARLLDLGRRLLVESPRVGVLLARDVGGYRPFKARLPELLEHRRPERRIVEGHCTERDHAGPCGRP